MEVTKNLLEALNRGNLLVGNFIYISSLAARGPDYEGKDNPISDYGKSKFEAESLVKASGLPFVAIRPTAVYGSGDKAFLELVKLIKYGLGLTIGSKSQKLTFIHGHDLARLTYIVKEKAGKTFYGHDGSVYSKNSLVSIIKMILGKKLVIPIHIPTGLVRGVSYSVNWIFNNIFRRSWTYNPPKIKELTALDWQIHPHEAQGEINFLPRYTLSEGFKEAIEYYQEKGWV